MEEGMHSWHARNDGEEVRLSGAPVQARGIVICMEESVTCQS
jgi:hypothetical protein